MRNVCNQLFPLPSLEMFAMQEESGALGFPLNSMLLPAVASSSCKNPLGMERGRSRLHSSQVIKCPRCDSINTKFCYYNNYNLSQPRHFCKSCRRYWTKGGVLRNVPVGGGCRKTNHSKKSKPRNSTLPLDKKKLKTYCKSKSASNSSPTASSSESSPITVNNNDIQENASSSTSFNSPGNGYRFGSELGEILNGIYGAADQGTTARIPRLFSGLDNLSPLKQPADFLIPGNLLSSIDANSCSYTSLLGRSNYAGVSFSDVQQKLAAFNGNKDQKPCPAADDIRIYSNNNSGDSHNDSNNTMIPIDWQLNNNGEFLFEDLYCWGTDPQPIWPDQEPIYLPE